MRVCDKTNQDKPFRTHEQQTRVKNNWDKHKDTQWETTPQKNKTLKNYKPLTWLNKHWCLDWQRSKITLQLHQRVWTYSSVVSSVVSNRNPPLAPNIKNHHKMIKQQFSCLTDREIQNTSVVYLSLVECCVQHINFTFIIKNKLTFNYTNNKLCSKDFKVPNRSTSHYLH